MSQGNTEQQQPSEEPQTRPPIDMEIVGDNIGQIAQFTVEKFEFANSTTLASEERDAAVRQIEDALWAIVEQLRKRRQEIRASMFRVASETLEDALQSKD
jgi:hypothetical protein